MGIVEEVRQIKFNYKNNLISVAETWWRLSKLDYDDDVVDNFIIQWNNEIDEEVAKKRRKTIENI